MARPHLCAIVRSAARRSGRVSREERSAEFVISRYTTPEMADLFSNRMRLRWWLEVELLVVEGWARIGRVPTDDAVGIRAAAPAIDEDFERDVAEREAKVRHDVAAFVDVVAARVGEQARWLHYGITSSDVVDTAMSVVLVKATSLVIHEANQLFDRLAAEARKHRATIMAGRTHGVHAQPITFGSKLALLALQLRRAIRRLELAKKAVSVGTISGAVGTFAQVAPEVEAYVCERLGLKRQPASQVLARDGRADLVYAFAATVTAVEAIALQVRLGHQTEVGELMEGFGHSQKGSSAMPHKSNPATAEKLCGLARLIRTQLVPSLENIVLWHERDLSHSSVDRVILPDSATVAHYCLRTASQLVSDWVVNTARMASNLGSSQDLICSEALLHVLVNEGWSRDEAYRTVQAAVSRARAQGGTLFQQALMLDLSLSESELRDALDPRRALLHVLEVVNTL